MGVSFGGKLWTEMKTDQFTILECSVLRMPWEGVGGIWSYGRNAIDPEE